MSRERFSNWTRSQTFCLTLNQTGIQNLLNMSAWEQYVKGNTVDAGDTRRYVPANSNPDDYGYAITSKSQSAYLDVRGMIQPCSVQRDNYKLTEVGEATTVLLKLAGFSADPHPWNHIEEDD